MIIENKYFKDEAGRTLLLRGVNLGGNSKMPLTNNGKPDINRHFFNYQNVSFIGRPFPLEEADEHFSRLKNWGLRFVRFLVTWEAIEHQGPGIYDIKYLDYLEKIVQKAAEYDIYLFIDPHQDVWCRWTSGDGAPAWTLEKIGMDLTKLDSVGAAYVHRLHDGPKPKMVWPTNYNRYGAATMFSLFFGGNDFAPKTLIEGIPVQEYLQRHYLNAILQVVKRLKKYSNVVGYEVMNEPHHGYIGTKNLAKVEGYFDISGPKATPFQSMCLTKGYTQMITKYSTRLSGAKPQKSTKINYAGLSLWKEGYNCPWQENGVWSEESGKPVLLQPNYFRYKDGQEINFTDDYLKPFIKKFTKTIRQEAPNAFIFVEGASNEDLPTWTTEDGSNMVSACHWYDGFTLFTKRFFARINIDTTSRKIIFGRKRIKKAFDRQLSAIKLLGQKKMGNVPTLIGEFGLPFDLNNKKAYKKNNFKDHIRLFDRYYNSMDKNFLNCTIWNYTADNCNDHGDLWNDEDLSIFSKDQQFNPDDLNSGGRALKGFCRPYALKTAGEPLSMRFQLKKQKFTFKYKIASKIIEPTEIFIPKIQYPHGFEVKLNSGKYKFNEKKSILSVYHNKTNNIQIIEIKTKK